MGRDGVMGCSGGRREVVEEFVQEEMEPEEVCFGVEGAPW